MKPLRTLIVDDEPLAVENLAAVLAGRADVEVVARGRNGEEALRYIRRGAVDLVFLDIQMPGLSGFDVVSRLEPESTPWIVFVTAYDEHAIRAFEAHALDYVLKPFDDARIARAVERARQAHADAADADFGRRLRTMLDGDASKVETPRLAVRSHGELVLIDPEEIESVEASDYCISIRGRTATWLVRDSLTSFSKRLDPRGFLRVHRGTVVNLDRVRRVRKTPTGAWFVVMENGTEWRVSRPHRRELERRLSERGGPFG